MPDIMEKRKVEALERIAAALDKMVAGHAIAFPVTPEAQVPVVPKWDDDNG